ncbi:holo-ACP synthase [Mucilaginibacter sp. 21P]|uniref:holo-ACP synthase n=1 Tax=Mucilaginibacter sp. 21P TaxID=2778902 RepID=UPI001C5942CC|nr:holo-ACP synthase [Mucilaginibacter sp. 21P]QXV63982.1 holo-ACP synthase [Mucilaginibacter sp. 21P]
MIIGIGCDIVEHAMTKRLSWSTNLHVQKRLFTENEIALAQGQNTDRFFSGRFAAKEAILKCLGTGMRDGIALTQLEILQTTAGQPVVLLEAEVKSIASEMGINKWHISISHSDHSSFAFVIAEI